MKVFVYIFEFVFEFEFLVLGLGFGLGLISSAAVSDVKRDKASRWTCHNLHTRTPHTLGYMLTQYKLSFAAAAGHKQEISFFFFGNILNACTSIWHNTVINVG